MYWNSDEMFAVFVAMTHFVAALTAVRLNGKETSYLSEVVCPRELLFTLTNTFRQTQTQSKCLF